MVTLAGVDLLLGRDVSDRRKRDDESIKLSPQREYLAVGFLLALTTADKVRIPVQYSYRKLRFPATQPWERGSSNFTEELIDGTWRARDLTPVSRM